MSINRIVASRTSMNPSINWPGANRISIILVSWPVTSRISINWPVVGQSMNRSVSQLRNEKRSELEMQGLPNWCKPGPTPHLAGKKIVCSTKRCNEHAVYTSIYLNSGLSPLTHSHTHVKESSATQTLMNSARLPSKRTDKKKKKKKTA